MRNYILFPNMKKLGIKIRIFTPSFYKISILLRTCVRGFEPPTPWSVAKCSIQLSYTHIYNSPAQSRNRTNDTRIFSPLLYQLSYLG